MLEIGASESSIFQRAESVPGLDGGGRPFARNRTGCSIPVFGLCLRRPPASERFQRFFPAIPVHEDGDNRNLPDITLTTRYRRISGIVGWPYLG